MKATKLLDGIKVADFSWALQAPLVTRILGDYGAEVIKVESTRRPDDIRAIPPYLGKKRGINRTWAMNNYNTNKWGITLDLDNPKGLELAKGLIKRCDIMIENFRPGVINKWGLDYQSVRSLNPAVIMISMSGTGQWGPMSKARFIGMHLQAYAGMTYFLGWSDRGPAAITIPYTDYIAPWMGTVAVLSALAHRRRTGEGRYMDVNQMESGLHFLAPALLDYAVNKRVQGRKGNRHSYVAPHGAYRCKGDDRWCTIVVFSDQDWEVLYKAMGNPSWAKDPRFATVTGRKRHEDELDHLIEEWTSNHSAEEVMHKLQEAGVDAGVVQNAEDLLEKDPQIRHRHNFIPINHPEVGEYLCQQIPFRLSKTSAHYERPGPCLGEHNEYVATKILGLNDDEFVECYSAGAFGFS